MHSSWLFNVRTWYNLTLFPWKASSARPSKRRSLTLFNQICNLQNSSTPFFQKHHLELDTGGAPSQKYPSIYAKLLQSCKPQQLQREGLAGFCRVILGPVLVMFFLWGGGWGKPYRDGINPNNFLIIKLDSPQISEFNDPCLVSMNTRRWWSPTYKA